MSNQRKKPGNISMIGPPQHLGLILQQQPTKPTYFTAQKIPNFVQPVHSVSSVSSSSTSSSSNSDLNNNNNSYKQTSSELNFKNFQLQQALKAATAALQKSKIMPFSSMNMSTEQQQTAAKPITTGNQHSFKPYSKQKDSEQITKVYRNTIVIETDPPVVNGKVNTSDYDNLDEDNIDISVHLNCNKETDNSKPESNKIDSAENEIITSSLLSSSSSASASSSLSSSTSSASSHSSSIKNSTSSSSNKQPDLVAVGLKSAFSSMQLSNNNNLNSDYNDYRSVSNQSGQQINDRELDGLLLDGIDNNVKKLNKKHKSASIDHLNMATSLSATDSNTNSNYNYEEIETNNNYLTNDYAYYYDNINSNKNCNYNGSNHNKQLPPPPHIQPFSGVLSKSLFSVVLKPQPVKPQISHSSTNNSNNSDTNLNSKEDQKPHNIRQRMQTPPQTAPSSTASVLFRDKLLVKKKCVSTTNLKYIDESLNNSFLQPSTNNNHKSVTFLDNEEKENYDHVEILLNEQNETNNRVLDLEKSLKQKINEVNQLKFKLKTAMEQNQMYQRQREISIEELEEEKQIFEQKLNAMRAHFNQQLSYFEQNERQCLQERVKSLQQCYNEIKMNYQKNLDNDLKHLKQKLNETQIINQQLGKQIQDMQNNTKCNCNKSKQMKQSNEQDLLLIIKQIKHENNELKTQLNAEREKFQNEKEKWVNEKRKVIQFQNYLQTNHNYTNNDATNNNLMNKLINKNLPSQNSFQQQVNNQPISITKSQQLNTSSNAPISIQLQHQQQPPKQRLLNSNNKNEKFNQQNFL